MSVSTNVYLSGNRLHKAPVIVCGMPRSGTTFVGQLLRSHSSMAIGDEFPLPSLSSVQKLLAETEELLTGTFEDWREIDRTSIPVRKMHLILSLWMAVTGDAEQMSRFSLPHNRPGTKTPNAELYWKFYEEVFAPAPPMWIYCVRHPVRVLRSFAAMFWSSEDPVEQVSELYRRSFEAYKELENRAQARVVAVGVDQAGGCASDRRLWATSIFDFLNEPLTHEVKRFMSDWPIVDHWSAARGKRRVNVTIDEQSLRWFIEQPHIKDFSDRFHYDLSG